jgi:hypothetical protein
VPGVDYIPKRDANLYKKAIEWTTRQS